jgi:hypothetical protein
VRTSVLAQLSARDTPNAERMCDERKGLQSLVRHVWFKLRKDEHLNVKKKGEREKSNGESRK